MQGLKFGDNRAYRFPIEEFYIPLTTSSSAGAGGASRRDARRSIPLQEALLAHRKLLVVGDPGSGKSTFLKRVTFQLCNEARNRRASPCAHRGGGALDLHRAAAYEDGARGYLVAGLDSRVPGSAMRGEESRPAGGILPCQAEGGRLPRADRRAGRNTGRGLARAAGETDSRSAAAFDGCRFVVTSRPEGKVPIRGFEEALIGDLEPEAIRAFLTKLAKQLYATDETREQRFREDLEAAVNGRREIRKMTRNPVMMTALAVLQHNNVKLPEKRVDLYGSILEWLSKQRAKPGRMPASDCLLRLRELALEMQNHEEGRKKQVALAWAGEKLAKRFANREAAERFLRAEQADSGIVVSRGKEIAFWHLTFQEYLAALEIAGWEDADQYKLLLSGGTEDLQAGVAGDGAAVWRAIAQHGSAQSGRAIAEGCWTGWANSRVWRIARSAWG